MRLCHLSSAVVGGASKIFSRGQTRANTAGNSGSPACSAELLRLRHGRPWFADQLIQLQEIQRIEGGLPGAVRTEPGGERQREPINRRPSSHQTRFSRHCVSDQCYPNAQSVEQASLIRLDAAARRKLQSYSLDQGSVREGTVSVPDETSVGMRPVQESP